MKVESVSILLWFLSVAQAFRQDSYEIEHDRIDVLEYNEAVVTRVDFKVVRYNESIRMKAINASGVIGTPIERNLKIKVVVYHYVAKAYRILPIGVTFDGCNIDKGDAFGLRSILNHTNLKGCPIPKGYLYLKYYYLEQDKFPPYTPFGKYKLFVNITYNDDIFIGNGNWYGEIVPKRKN